MKQKTRIYNVEKTEIKNQYIKMKQKTRIFYILDKTDNKNMQNLDKRLEKNKLNLRKSIREELYPRWNRKKQILDKTEKDSR